MPANCIGSVLALAWQFRYAAPKSAKLPNLGKKLKTEIEGEISAQASEERITGFQIVALLACLLLNVQDGFDILSIAYSANAIAMDWALSPGKLGAILSASLFGIMLGAMFLSPYADRIGRKPMTIVGLIISGIGMIGAAAAINPDMLLLSRCITGIGIGGILASLNTLVAEYAGERYRSMAVAIFQMGFPLGAVIGGYVAGWLLDIGDWRHVFAFGAILSFVFVPVVMLLPESMDYLAKSGKADALSRINQVNQKLGRPKLTELQPVGKQIRPSPIGGVMMLFSSAFRNRTLLIWLAFFFLQMTLYFALSWVPKLLIEQGMSEADGIRGGMAVNLLGVVGIITFAIISTRHRAPVLGTLSLIGASLILFYLGTLDGIGQGTVFSTLLVVAFIGFFAHASMIALYATSPTLYPSEIRATGTGWAIGLSRLGAVFGPWLTGQLLGQGWDPSAIYPVFGIPTLLAAAAVGTLAYLTRPASG